MLFTQTAHRGIVTFAGLVALVGALAGTPARADHEHLTVTNIGSSGDSSTPDKDAQQVLRREPTDPEPAIYMRIKVVSPRRPGAVAPPAVNVPDGPRRVRGPHSMGMGVVDEEGEPTHILDLDSDGYGLDASSLPTSKPAPRPAYNRGPKTAASRPDYRPNSRTATLTFIVGDDGPVAGPAAPTGQAQAAFIARAPTTATPVSHSYDVVLDTEGAGAIGRPAVRRAPAGVPRARTSGTFTAGGRDGTEWLATHLAAVRLDGDPHRIHADRGPHSMGMGVVDEEGEPRHILDGDRDGYGNQYDFVLTATDGDGETRPTSESPTAPR